MNTLRVSLLCALVAVAFSLQSPTAAAADVECLPEISDGWIRVPPAAIPVLAGFGTIHNACDAAVTVVSGSSPGFDDVSIHETRFEDGMARMRAIPRLVIPAGDSVTLKPGGLHMMLMKPRATPVAGDQVRIDLQLEDGRKISGDFRIRK